MCLTAVSHSASHAGRLCILTQYCLTVERGMNCEEREREGERERERERGREGGGEREREREGGRKKDGIKENILLSSLPSRAYA